MQNWYLCRIVGETPADFKSYFYPLIIMNLAKIKSGVYYFMFSQFDAKSQVFSLFHCFVEWRENLWVLTIMQNIGTKYLHEIKILQNVLPCRKYDGHRSWCSGPGTEAGMLYRMNADMEGWPLPLSNPSQNPPVRKNKPHIHLHVLFHSYSGLDILFGPTKIVQK